MIRFSVSLDTLTNRSLFSRVISWHHIQNDDRLGCSRCLSGINPFLEPSYQHESYEEPIKLRVDLPMTRLD